MKKILYVTSLVFLPSSFNRWIYGGNIMLYRISVAERGLTGIANIFRSRLSRLDDLLRAGTVPLNRFSSWASRTQYLDWELSYQRQTKNQMGRDRQSSHHKPPSLNGASNAAFSEGHWGRMEASPYSTKAHRGQGTTQASLKRDIKRLQKVICQNGWQCIFSEGFLAKV